MPLQNIIIVSFDEETVGMVEAREMVDGKQAYKQYEVDFIATYSNDEGIIFMGLLQFLENDGIL